MTSTGHTGGCWGGGGSLVVVAVVKTGLQLLPSEWQWLSGLHACDPCMHHHHQGRVLRILEMYGELLKMVKNLYRIVYLQFDGLGY